MSPSARRMAPTAVKARFMGFVPEPNLTTAPFTPERQASRCEIPPEGGEPRGQDRRRRGAGRHLRAPPFVLGGTHVFPAPFEETSRPNHARMGGEALRAGGRHHPRRHGAVRL